MAIRIEAVRKLNAVELVSVNDDAIDLEASDIAEYKKTGDMGKLKFIADKQPTIFLMNFELKGREAELVKNSILGGKDEHGDPQLSLGSWALKVVRFTLKGINNPADLPLDAQIVYKKNEHGHVHDDTLNILDRLGLVDELFNFYISLVKKPERANAKN